MSTESSAGQGAICWEHTQTPSLSPYRHAKGSPTDFGSCGLEQGKIRGPYRNQGPTPRQRACHSICILAQISCLALYSQFKESAHTFEVGVVKRGLQSNTRCSEGSCPNHSHPAFGSREATAAAARVAAPGGPSFDTTAASFARIDLRRSEFSRKSAVARARLAGVARS